MDPASFAAFEPEFFEKLEIQPFYSLRVEFTERYVTTIPAHSHDFAWY